MGNNDFERMYTISIFVDGAINGHEHIVADSKEDALVKFRDDMFMNDKDVLDVITLDAKRVMYWQ